MKMKWYSMSCTLLVFTALTLIGGCGGRTAPNAPQANQGGVTISIGPSSASLQVNATLQFTATVSGTTNTAVTWSASSGTISTSGLFKAPASAGTATVTATSAADSTQKASATITVTAAPPPPAGVSVTVSPAAVSVQAGSQQQFSATVSGSTNQSVTWSASSGSISTTGLFTAPAAAGTATVTATSAADTTKKASATVTVTAPPPPAAVSVSVSPNAASIAPGAQQQFQATVTGTTNTAVTWTASGGTVSSTGLYTAPATTGTFTVVATSAADTTKSASAIVNVSTPGTGGGLPTAKGFSILSASTTGKNTALNSTAHSVCANQTDVHGVEGCNAVFTGWSGGVADTKRNRLIIQGGGHTDYNGNEIYALDLNANPPAFVRLNEPTRTTDAPGGQIASNSADGCAFVEAVPVGCTGSQCKISSRHTRDTLVYISALDTIYEYGSSHPTQGTCNPSIRSDMWSLSAAAIATAGREDVTTCTNSNGCITSASTPWQYLKTSDQAAAEVGKSLIGFEKSVEYDPNTNKIFIIRPDNCDFYQYDVAANKFSFLRGGACGAGAAESVIDPVKKQFVTIGGGTFISIDISSTTFPVTDHSSQLSCQPLFNAGYPGLTYDSVAGKIVGYPGSGNTIYILDTTTWTCTSEAYGATQGVDFPTPTTNGMHGRFNYFPLIDAWAVCTDPTSNCFLLRRR